jgi:hypothetical protein
MLRRPRITLLRLMTALAATAPVFALLAAADVSPELGLLFGALPATSMAGIVLLAPTYHEALAALFGVGFGVVFGLLFIWTCLGGFGFLVGAGLGLFVAETLRRAARR